MSKASVQVEIHADVRPLQRGLIRAQLRVTRSFWRRLLLRLELWRLR